MQPVCVRDLRMMIVAAALYVVPLLAAPASLAGDGGRVDRVRYVALGDSIAEGVGAAGGYGYVYRLRDALEGTRGNVDLLNLGKGGFAASDLVALLADDGEVRATVQSADLITISIGGNHMLGCATDNFASVDRDCVAIGIQLFERDWPTILDLARSGSGNGTNATARILALSLFNPYTAEDPIYASVEALIQRLNSVIRDEQYRARYGYEVVEVHDDFEGQLNDGRWKTCVWLRFCEATRDPHPTDAGHDEIARLHLRTYLGRI